MLFVNVFMVVYIILKMYIDPYLVKFWESRLNKWWPLLGKYQKLRNLGITQQTKNELAKMKKRNPEVGPSRV